MNGCSSSSSEDNAIFLFAPDVDALSCSSSASDSDDDCKFIRSVVSTTDADFSV